jgi:2'-5' RNA ligase
VAAPLEPAAQRLFVALALPGEARAALAAFRDAVDPAVWRPVGDASLHVTLAFLGRRPAADAGVVAGVLAALPGAVARPVELAVDGVLLLPPRRPGVLALGLDDASGRLGALQAALVDGLVGAGVHEREARPFLPHVTVARLRARVRPPRRGDPVPAPPALAFRATSVVLYESVVGRGGAAYTPLAGRALR